MLNTYSSPDSVKSNVRNSFLGAYIVYIPIDELFPDNLSYEERDTRRHILRNKLRNGSLADVRFFNVTQTGISEVFMLYINFIMYADKIYYSEKVTAYTVPGAEPQKLERNLASDIAIKNDTVFTGHDQYTIAAMDEMYGNLHLEFDMATLKNVLKLVAVGWRFNIKREPILKAIWPKFYYAGYNKNLECLLYVSESDFATALELYQDLVNVAMYFECDSYVLYKNLKNIKKIYEFYAYNLRAIFAIINSFFCLYKRTSYYIIKFSTDDGLRGVGYYDNEMIIGNYGNVRSKVKITFCDKNITKIGMSNLYYDLFAELIIKKSRTFLECNILQVFRDFGVDRFDCQYRNQPYPGTYERFSLDRQSGNYISQKSGRSIAISTDKLLRLDLLNDDAVIKMTIF